MENLENINLGSAKQPVALQGKVFNSSGFIIPKLKTGTSATPSKLNNFISNQLELKAGLAEAQSTKTEFTIPKLGLPLNFSKEHLTPYEQSMKKIIQSKINDISNGVKNISLKENQPQVNANQDSIEVIDLSSALNIGNNVHPKNNRRASVKTENFAIPFIDCDLPKVRKHTYSDVDNFKVKDLKLKPTKFGKVTSMKYRRIQSVPIDHCFSPKHTIIPFKFDTKSPDELLISQRK